MNKKTAKAALSQVKEYFEAITRSDISRVDGVDRDQHRAKRLMRSYARLQGTMAGVPTIVADMKTNESEGMSDETVVSYIKALKKIFVIEDMPAWNPNLRSKTAIRTSDTRYFVDPSIAIAALGLGPDDLLNDLETMGLLFETLCAQGLAQQNDTTVGSAENRKTSHVKNRNTNPVQAFQISSIISLHLAGVILIVAPHATRSFRVGLPLPMTEVACSP